MKKSSPEVQVDEILGSLQAGLKQAERTMAAMMEGLVADNAVALTELELALTRMEDDLSND